METLLWNSGTMIREPSLVQDLDNRICLTGSISSPNIRESILQIPEVYRPPTTIARMAVCQVMAVGRASLIFMLIRAYHFV